MSNTDQTFNVEAVRLALTLSESIAQTARDLGIKENTLYTWGDKSRVDGFIFR